MRKYPKLRKNEEPMEQVDLVIQARWIIPVEPHGTVLDHHAIAIRDRRIVALLPATDVSTLFSSARTVDRPQHVLFPGLVNAHTHASMTLFRGMADDMPLENWLGDHIWPAEARWASPDFVRDGASLAIIEMLRGGTTCFQDMYFFPDIVAQTAVEQNIRAVVGMIVINMPTAWAGDTDEYLSKGIAVHDQYKGHPLVSTTFAPHAPYTINDDTCERLRMLANEFDTQIHMHVHETNGEIKTALRENGRRPLARLEELGLVNSLLTAVHMTQLLDEEISLLAERGVNIVHCPESNLKLASGFCPTARLLEAGINVALGTDSAASNNDLDMFGEMRSAALLGKGVADDAAALSAEDALSMATINGARAVGLGDQIGSLEPGKMADMICVDMNEPATQPVHHPISQLVYSASRDQVADVWVGGKHVLEDRRLSLADQVDIMERAAAWQRRLAESDAEGGESRP
jgi:5-methylthioadenosine/S-adenosylhomocysteine deaminase